jgi:hypothetical protein
MAPGFSRPGLHSEEQSRSLVWFDPLVPGFNQAGRRAGAYRAGRQGGRQCRVAVLPGRAACAEAGLSWRVESRDVGIVIKRRDAGHVTTWSASAMIVS